MAELNLNPGESVLKLLDFIKEKQGMARRTNVAHLILEEFCKQYAKNVLAWPPEFVTEAEKAKRILAEKSPRQRKKKR